LIIIYLLIWSLPTKMIIFYACTSLNTYLYLAE